MVLRARPQAAAPALSHHTSAARVAGFTVSTQLSAKLQPHDFP